MPARPRTSETEIVAAARAILEADGLDALTMQRVANAVHVRPPSLYKRIRDRSGLVRLVATEIARELAVTLDAAGATTDPRRDLEAIAIAFRAFAIAHPEGFRLLFGPLPEAMRIDVDLAAEASGAVLRAVARIADPGEELEAARLIAAWAIGFTGMELSGAFRLGGDIDRAFAYGIERLVSAIDRRPLPPDVDRRPSQERRS